MGITPFATFISRDGTPIACSKTGTGPPLVLVHGTGADGTRWARVLPALAAQYTVYACDRRGRGASGDAPAYALANEVEDLLAVLDGISVPATLLGHSFGGICALEAALRAPRLHYLALYEPPIGIPIQPPGILDRLQAMLDAGDRDGLVTTFFREIGLPDEQITRLRNLPAWPARVAAAHTIPREIRAQQGYLPDADALHTMRWPVLLLLGGASSAGIADATNRLRDTLRHAGLSVLPDQQHTAMDTAPDTFAREVLALRPRTV
jgi:pimeloyl-ACP methyl ester carboxylesterase